jgi:hypothetical protein
MADDPLAGLPRPLGDPGASSSAGRRYTAASEQLNTAGRHILSVVQSLVGGDWVGMGSSSAVGCTVALAGAYTRTAEAARTAGSGLTHFSTSLAHAQAQWDHARRLASQAVQDEQSYVVNAERQAQTLDTQAATGNIGAAHAAASIRSDAASYVSPLRARSVSMATQARQDATQAGQRAAGMVGDATAMVPTPPPAPSPNTPVDNPDGGLLKWFNEWILGGGGTAAALLTLPPAAVSGAHLLSAMGSASQLPRELQTLFDESVGPLALAADRGLVPWSAVASRARDFSGAAELFSNASEGEVAASRASFLRGGLPDSPAFEVVGKGLGVFGIVGDVGVMVDPGGDSGTENTINRGAAGANAISTLVVLNATTDEIPVAGEVVMVGTGVYLGGDWLYHHWTPFHDAADATGNFVVHTVPNALGDAADAAGGVVHDIEPWNW